VMHHLTKAWDNADGAAFGSVFTDDADFVNILGGLFSGRDAIAAQHQAIFDTIYKGSSATFDLHNIRTLDDDVAVAHVLCALDAPGGPRPGRTNTLATAVLARRGEAWRIAAFHNTVIIPIPG